jgi:hypothetical protein
MQTEKTLAGIRSRVFRKDFIRQKEKAGNDAGLTDPYFLEAGEGDENPAPASIFLTRGITRARVMPSPFVVRGASPNRRPFDPRRKQHFSSSAWQMPM